MARPSPEPAPVTTATRSWKRISLLSTARRERLAQLRDGERLAGGAVLGRAEEAVDGAREALHGHLDAGGAQLVRVELALVAQRIELGRQDQRGRQPGEA